MEDNRQQAKNVALVEPAQNTNIYTGLDATVADLGNSYQTRSEKLQTDTQDWTNRLLKRHN